MAIVTLVTVIDRPLIAPRGRSENLRQSEVDEVDSFESESRQADSIRSRSRGHGDETDHVTL